MRGSIFGGSPEGVHDLTGRIKKYKTTGAPQARPSGKCSWPGKNSGATYPGPGPGAGRLPLWEGWIPRKIVRSTTQAICTT